MLSSKTLARFLHKEGMESKLKSSYLAHDHGMVFV